MNSEHIILNKINAFKKKIWECGDSQKIEELSVMLDNIMASLPDDNETTYFKALHDFFCQMSDRRLFDKPDFVNEVFRKLLNLYAHYLDNDSLAVCAVFVNSILTNETFCDVNDIQNLLNYLQQINKIDLPIFPMFENDECCDTLQEILSETKKVIDENPYFIFYSFAHLRERLGESVAEAIENYKNIQIILDEDSLGIGALVLLSQIEASILDDYRLTCIVSPGSVAKCRRWLENPANRNWLSKKAKFHHEAKKILKHIKDEPVKKTAATFYLSARSFLKFPELSDLQVKKLQGIFLILDCFEPVLPDFSFYNVVWANWDKPNFVRYKNSDRFFTLGCAIFGQDSEKSAMSLIDFYKSLRGIKNEAEVLEKMKSTSLKSPQTSSDFLIKADIFCRAGKFEESFELVKDYYEAKITAAYRICNSILRHSKNPELYKKVSAFVDERQLFQRAFCAELHDIADNTENDKKSRWL